MASTATFSQKRCLRHLSKDCDDTLLPLFLVRDTRALCKSSFGLGYASWSKTECKVVSSSCNVCGLRDISINKGPTSPSNDSRQSLISSWASSLSRFKTSINVCSTAYISVSVLDIHSRSKVCMFSLDLSKSCSILATFCTKSTIPLANCRCLSCLVSYYCSLVSSCLSILFRSDLNWSDATVTKTSINELDVFWIELIWRSC